MTLLLCTLLAVQPRFLGPPEKNPDAGVEGPVRKGDLAPPLSGELESPDDAGVRTLELAALVGRSATDPARAVLIAFFDPGCAGCAEELQIVRQLADEYRARGLRAVVVHLAAGDRPPLSSLDAQRGIAVVRDRWKISARRWLGAGLEVPAMFVVGRDGDVRAAAASCAADAVAGLRAAIDDAVVH